MGFHAETHPSGLPGQQSGCNDDARFFNSMVVIHNPSTAERRYWKLKGKNPDTLVINTGSNGVVNIHLLMIPTPPTDYAGGTNFATNTKMYPIPIYDYQYKISLATAIPSGFELAPEEP
jgi:hypothetical protein